ncbi:MAG: hypothetical protein EBT80_08480 [Chitinophagales bacterium]|nr:hypothetical protein [Chitinophagales bacterium]
MNPAALLSHQVLIETIRSSRSQKKVIELIDSALHSVRAEAADGAPFFLKSLRSELSSIDPIEVADPEEWNLIQFSRIYLHRLMQSRPVAM